MDAENKPEPKMNNASINTTVTTTPDFSGFKFYVEAGQAFDADDYTEYARLNRADLDPRDVHATQHAATQLGDGEWLEISHEIGE
jgi:hypothetical protein